MDVVDEFDVGPSAPKDKLEKLADLVKEASKLADLATQLEADAKVAWKALYALIGHPTTVQTAAIPDLMAELQLEKISVAGFDLVLVDELIGSLPKDPERREDAIRWLEKHDGAGIIQTRVGLTFSRSEHNRAISTYEALKGQGLEPELLSDVHHSTLKAYIRQRLKDGDEIEPEVLGVYVGKTVKMKESKK